MSRRDGSIAIGMVAAVALVAAAPVVIAELAGGDALAVGVSVTFVAAGILWSRKPISQRYRAALERLRDRGEIDVEVDALAHILRMRRAIGWTATTSGAVTLAFALAAL